MSKIASRIAVKFYTLDTQTFKQTRHDDSAHRINSVEHHGEMSSFHSLHIYIRKFQHLVQVFIRKVLIHNSSEMVHITEIEIP